MISKLKFNMTQEELITAQNTNNAFLQSIALPVGAVIGFPSENIPLNTLICDGSAVSRADYCDLFAIIGETYGSGDGKNTFNLPDYRGRFLVGKTPTDPEFSELHYKGGSKTHSQTVDEMPKHSHSIMGMNPTAGEEEQFQNYPLQIANDTKGNWPANSVGTNGNGLPMDIMNPYHVTNWVIVAYAGNTNNQKDIINRCTESARAAEDAATRAEAIYNQLKSQLQTVNDLSEGLI